jgi:hypothetical protein
MQITSEQTSPCEVQLKIEVEPEQVTEAYGLAYRKFARVTNVPGFRKGKAPRAILEKYVPAEAVQEEAMEYLVAHSYVEALKQEKLEPYAGPEVKTEDLEEGKQFVFTAKVPLPPEVELGEYKGIEVEKQAAGSRTRRWMASWSTFASATRARRRWRIAASRRATSSSRSFPRRLRARSRANRSAASSSSARTSPASTRMSWT